MWCISPHANAPTVPAVDCGCNTVSQPVFVGGLMGYRATLGTESELVFFARHPFHGNRNGRELGTESIGNVSR